MAKLPKEEEAFPFPTFVLTNYIALADDTIDSSDACFKLDPS